jgi:hypothetical protein
MTNILLIGKTEKANKSTSLATKKRLSVSTKLERNLAIKKDSKTKPSLELIETLATKILLNMSPPKARNLHA